MSTQQSQSTTSSHRERSGLVHALVGAAVMVFLSWIPFVPVVGGGIAGYLEGDQPSEKRSASSRGLRVGALAGGIATIPAIIVGFLAGSFLFASWFGVGMMGGMDAGPAFGVPFLGFLVFAFVFVGIVVYHVALGALGGWLGAELASN